MDADFVGWEDYDGSEQPEADIRSRRSSRKHSLRHERPRSGSVIDRLKRLFRIAKEDPDLEDFESHSNRYVPASLELLQKSTKFSRHEIQLIYRGFKQDCPTGIVSCEKFRELYSQFFPLGDATVFARHIFQTMDQDADGLVNFEEFIMVMSVLIRGSMDEKLQWIFNLYDIRGEGYLILDNMTEIGLSVYELMGKHTVPSVSEFTVKDHIHRIFNMMDTNHDGIVTFDEFKAACVNNDRIKKNLMVFGTLF